jgi:hypothetical protein
MSSIVGGEKTNGSASASPNNLNDSKQDDVGKQVQGHT